MTKSKHEEPNVGDNPNVPNPKEYQGCPCMCFNASRRERVDAEKNKPITFPTPGKQPGTSNFSTFKPLPWDGTTFIVPVSGIYFTMASAMRASGGQQDDSYLRLVSSIHGVIDSAQIGETAVRFKKPKYGDFQYDRQTGVFHRVSYFTTGEKLWLDTTTEAGRDIDLEDVKWSLFHICCNPGLEVPCPC